MHGVWLHVPLKFSALRLKFVAILITSADRLYNTSEIRLTSNKVYHLKKVLSKYTSYTSVYPQFELYHILAMSEENKTFVYACMHAFL